MIHKPMESAGFLTAVDNKGKIKKWQNSDLAWANWFIAIVIFLGASQSEVQVFILLGPTRENPFKSWVQT